MTKLTRFLFAILSIVLLTSTILVGFFVLPATVRYQVTERYRFSGAPPGSPVYLVVMVPQSGPYQEVESLDVAWEGAQTQETHGQVVVVKLEGASGDDGTQEAIFGYDITLWQGKARWDAPVEAFQLEPQFEVESDHPHLVGQARALANGQSREDAYRLYAFTASHIAWPKEDNRIGGDQSALTAFQTGVGVCGDFANLMTALNRAAGIPGQSITGLLFPPSPPLLSTSRTGFHPAGSHAWTEFQTEVGWEMADPSWASQLPSDRLWFGRNDGMHLSYGEKDAHNRTHEEMMAWAESRGNLIVAMSAPLKFAASAGAEGVAVEPTVTVKKGWDGRWVTTIELFVVWILALMVVERRVLRRKKKD